jgi:tetratricopeptide (TPR) repeat protein
MNRSFLAQAARDNWYLIAAFLLLVVSIPVFALRSDPSEATEIPPSNSKITLAAGLGDVEYMPVAARSATEVRARQTIAEHQQRFDADPKSVEAPALLGAMGNLYRQKLSDYEQAAGCFERLISEYPDDSGVRDAYLQLMICYERLGDQENRSRVLRRIMSAYPPESEEHAYAALQLGIVE